MYDETHKLFSGDNKLELHMRKGMNLSSSMAQSILFAAYAGLVFELVQCLSQSGLLNCVIHIAENFIRQVLFS